ncbi:MAG: methylated-DNA--[protein]-cysteine S-methyltransferase [Acidobacteria bacterium]|nr:methylated-DNA--[protein]-cysteine S-methyltransferase [Acidobacteriota bacterium]
MHSQRDHQTFYTYVDTPVGTLMLAGCDDHGLRYVSFPCGKGARTPEPHWKQSATPFHEVKAQLAEYFGGTRTTFDLKLHVKGTPFQIDVWKALMKIPYGETCAYGELAERIGRPRAVRAVGLANGRNPLPIVVPCHRVIGSTGALVGYGGGLPVKEALIALERRVSAARPARTRPARQRSLF